MDRSVNDMTQSGHGDYSPENSVMNMSKHDKSRASNQRGTPKTKRRSKNDSQGRNFRCNQ